MTTLCYNPHKITKHVCFFMDTDLQLDTIKMLNKNQADSTHRRDLMPVQDMDITDALCRNVADTRFEDLDESIVTNAKNRIIDVLGCVAAGADAECNQALIQIIKVIN